MAILSFKQLTQTKPIAHFGIMLAVYLLLLLLSYFLKINHETKWICIYCILIFYSWISPIVGSFANNWIKYTLTTTVFIALLFTIIIALEKLIFNDFLFDTFSNAMLFTATLIFYMVAIGIGCLFRFLVLVLDQSSE